jgi:hypothetical protein
MRVKGALITEASIDLTNPDTYRFRAKAGEYINAEVVSFTNNLDEISVDTRRSRVPGQPSNLKDKDTR